MQANKLPTKTITRLRGAVAASAAVLLGTAAQAAGVSGQGTWETTLLARDLNADSITDAFYDTVLDISWLANANQNGTMTWAAANTWAAGLDVHGVTGWRLPTMIDTGTSGCDFSYAGGTDCGYNVQTKSGATVYSEMAHLWYVALGNKAYCPPGDASCAGGPQAGWGLSNTGDFENMQSYYYWSGREYAPNPSFAWDFYTSDGYQNADYKNLAFYAMAVRPGDVAAVPEPAAYGLALAALSVLAVARRQRPH